MLKLVRVIDMPVTYIQDYYKLCPATYLINKELLDDKNKYIKKIIEREADLKNNIFEYFMVDDDNPHCIIGYCRLTDNNPQQILVGDIAYEIEPSKRNQGYGTKILELALQEWQRLGKRKTVYVSCKPHNVASKKVIKANGGIFDMNFDVLHIGKGIRYKFDLKKIKLESKKKIREI